MEKILEDTRVILFGCTKFSEQIFNELINNSVKIVGIFTIPKHFGISYSEEKVLNVNYVDFFKLGEKYNIPVYTVESGKKKNIASYQSVIKSLNPSVILVMGWYFMVPKKIRDIPVFGAWGIHASMLPDYAGGAPLVWSIIKGDTSTGVTLFKLGSGVDDGDIIEQREVAIEITDTIKELYEKVTLISKNILISSLLDIECLETNPQEKDKIKVYPQRSPEDGLIDLSWSKEEIFNFIRAQSSPYPGAFIELDGGERLFIEKVRIERKK